MKDIKDTQLQEIATHLIINASHLSNLGLFRGKMGIILFFVHYAKYTNDSIYKDFAEKLLDEIYDEIHNDLSINFENGLCGIAWGILYLIQNGFVQGDPNETLIEIDKKIMEIDLLRIQEKSLKRGLKGISSYIQLRLNTSQNNDTSIIFDEQYLSNWKVVKKQIKEDFHIELQSILCTNNFNYNTQINSWILGIEKGCAGYGLKFLLA